MNKSIILNCDSYKTSHFNQYPENTSFITSYGESRISENFGDFPNLLYFGMQMFIKEYLSNPITMPDIFLAEQVFNNHFGGKARFNREGWEYIVKTHGGYLPIHIRSIAEGSVIKRGNILFDVVNTDHRCFWLTSYIETSLLRAIWYPSTIASIGYETKNMIRSYYERTCDDLSGLDFSVHDFGARGVSSFESSGIGGLAHLLNFSGTDNITALLYAMEYYGADVAAFSVPATEHSTMTIRGEDKEFEQLKHIIDNNLVEGGILSIVGDSYNIYRFTEQYIGTELIDIIRNSGGKLVIRPDSGIPEEIDLEIIKIIANTVGYSLNSKGYAKLPSYIGMIQGDGINFLPKQDNTINKVLEVFEKNGFASDNIVFGSGGSLLQKVNRDTFSFAMKACHAIIDGQSVDIFKKPVHNKSGKDSKRGKMNLIYDKTKKEFKTVNRHLKWDEVNHLETVYLNGKIISNESFKQIRNRITQ